MYEDDLAMIKTKDPIVFGEDVGFICLPFRYIEDDYALLQNKDVTIARWGATKAIAAVTMKVTPQTT